MKTHFKTLGPKAKVKEHDIVIYNNGSFDVLNKNDEIVFGDTVEQTIGYALYCGDKIVRILRPITKADRI